MLFEQLGETLLDEGRERQSRSLGSNRGNGYSVIPPENILWIFSQATEGRYTPISKPFNDFSATGDKLPSLKSVREFRERVREKTLPREYPQLHDMHTAVDLILLRNIQCIVELVLLKRIFFALSYKLSLLFRYLGTCPQMAKKQ